MAKKDVSKKTPLSSAADAPQKIVPQMIEDEMKVSYLNYAMSVIVSRALPDVRDGLKPVHRRILYAMWSVGLRANAKFRKSATVVGEVLGKYHPHGDASVYDAMVRMAQKFSMRAPLVLGQGNFGSMDGDSPAAMRYTEAKLSGVGEELLFDLDKETVPFYPNYDETQKEPRPLPAKIPNLIVNGAMGIAVGMATNIPPHNVGEVCNALIAFIDRPEMSVEEIMEYIPGPDFPTGAIIYNKEEIKRAYATGKGGIVMRAKTEIEEMENGEFRIIASEMPYQVNKATLVEKIADLVRAKKIEGIKGLRDESDKDGVRVVIELKKDSYPQKVLNQLFKHTQLQETFHVNMLALIDGIQPRVLTMRMVLEEYVKHRRTIVENRTKYDLKKAEERAHILEGLKIAIDAIDAVIKTIRASADKDQARVRLMKQFSLSERQAVAILEMRLQNLANLERLKVELELKEKRALIKELKDILASPQKILQIIKGELSGLVEKYADPRRTKIVKGELGEFSQEDLIPDEQTVVMVTQDGYIKSLQPEAFKLQGRGGKGVIGLTTKEEDMVDMLFSTRTHADILFFTSKGRVFQLKAYEIPQASRTSRGKALVNFLQITSDEKITALLPVSEFSESAYLVMVTKNAVIKKVSISAFAKVRRSGLMAVKLKDDDELRWVKISSGKDHIILVTARGQAIRFKETDIRPMGRTASGVRGMRLKQDDEVVGMDIIDTASEKAKCYLMVVMEHGFGKRTQMKEYKAQGRGGSGIKTAKITTKTGRIVHARVVNEGAFGEDVKGEFIIMSEHGQVIRLPFKSVNIVGRSTQGVRLMRFKDPEDKVASVALV
ncbi:MAG: gyrase subunit A protein [Parcubacteria group bacterium GW2011_GWA2_44_12]|nr:MAG: gyrase subunit A protein [Parcubacteria group bacterium GW2011_GWA2_44_12]